jgi:RNA polymerase sigma factor (sigma-70 family)
MLDCQQSRIHDVYVRYRLELCSAVANKFRVSRDEAEDIVHAAFARVVEIKDRTIKNPRALLYKTSYNIAIDRKRHGAVCQKHVDSVIGAESAAVEELGPERVFEGNRQLHIVQKVMWEMSEKRRKLFVMSRFDGLSYAEIARRVGQ